MSLVSHHKNNSLLSRIATFNRRDIPGETNLDLVDHGVRAKRIQVRPTHILGCLRALLVATRGSDDAPQDEHMQSGWEEFERRGRKKHQCDLQPQGTIHGVW